MQVTSISNLPQSTAFFGVEIFPIVQSSIIKQIATSTTNFISSSDFHNIMKLNKQSMMILSHVI